MKMVGGKLLICWMRGCPDHAQIMHKGRIFGLLKLRRDTSPVLGRANHTHWKGSINMKRLTLAGLLIVAVLLIAGWTFQPAPTRARFEYKSITVDYAGTPTAADVG
jgi:hypothetical protein